MRLISLCPGRSIGWFRFGRFGWGLHWKNINRETLRFSERYGYTKPTMRVGHWWLTILRPYKSR